MTGGHRPPRPKALLDAIEAEAAAHFAGTVWRVVTDGFNPLRPSRAGGRWKRIFQIEAVLNRVLDLSAQGKLAALGVNMATYGRLAYIQRTDEYPTLQQIAEIAFFYEYEAIIVPNARWPTSNAVIFTENTRPSQLAVVGSETVDLAAWDESVRGARS